MKVKCKNNYRDKNWNFLVFKIGEVYNAEIFVTERRDFIKVFNEITKETLFTFKNFSEYFKIVEED